MFSIDMNTTISIIAAAISFLAAVFVLWQAKIAQDAYKLQIEPDVIVYLRKGAEIQRQAFIEIKNIGKGIAYDIEVTFSDDIKIKPTLRNFLNGRSLKYPIRFLEPMGTRLYCLGAFPELLPDAKNIHAHIVFKDKQGSKFSEDCLLDFTSFHDNAIEEKKETAALAQIASSLKSISKTLK